MPSRIVWPVILGLSALIAGVLTFVGDAPQARVVVVLWFLLVCPGMMLVRFFRLREPLFEWVLAITLSMALDTIIGGILLYTGHWSPDGAFAIILALTVVGVFVQTLLDFSPWRSAAQPPLPVEA
jgi:uncharacterized membrane protein